MHKFIFFLFFVLFAVNLCGETFVLSDLNIRDPCIVADKKTKTYYLYASKSQRLDSGKTIGGVCVYTSKDLTTWEGPTQVFTVPENNWATGNVWAPEVHIYKGKFYLFATINTDVRWKGDKPDWAAYTYRGTQIFWSKSPFGPFQPFDIYPHTPMDQMALDGTLWVENGQPYLVYCHEWVDVEDGTIEFRQLKKDLSAPVTAPTRLFCASSAPWIATRPGLVTDGCYLYRTRTGKLLMTWSSFSKTDYSIGIAESVTNTLAGPWRQQPEPIFTGNGGHNMIFRTFDGRLCTVFHCPNSPSGKERPMIYELEDTGESLKLKNRIQ